MRRLSVVLRLAQTMFPVEKPTTGKSTAATMAAVVMTAAVMATSVILATGSYAPAFAGTLYQWTGKDGTQTYSPDPPPNGVKYEIVGDDLKPLPKTGGTRQAAAAAAPAPATAPANRGSTGSATGPRLPSVKTNNPRQARQPTAAKPVAPWKPVKYANDPKTQAPPQTGAARAEVTEPLAVKIESPACTTAKQQKALLESEFARAATDEQMDRAILKLRDQKAAYKTACDS